VTAGADKWSWGLPYVGVHPWDKAGGRDRAVAHWHAGSTAAGANGGCARQSGRVRRGCSEQGHLEMHGWGGGFRLWFLSTREQ
jgi:hypothetical protein